RLPVDRLAVALARVTQNDAEDMRAPTLAVRLHDRNAGAEIHLGFLAGRAFQAAEGQRLVLPQPLDKAPHAGVPAAKAVLADQVLEDALGRQAGGQLLQDDWPPGLAQAGGWLLRCGRCWGADGRPLGSGRFWFMGALLRGGLF